MLLLNFSISPAIGLLVISHLPEINWILMVSCLLVVIGFRDTEMIGIAYGCEGRKDSHAFETNLIETLAEF